MQSETQPLVHDTESQRFIHPMTPSDAFVEYHWKGDQMILHHIEIDPSLRGSGFGARFACEVLEQLQDSPLEIRLTCPFLRQVAKTRVEWRRKFFQES